MKWNATSAGAACLAVGIGGFLAGKLTNDSPKPPSEAEQLLSRADQVSSSRSTADQGDSQNRRLSANRSRVAGERSSFDERLVKMEDIIRGENALDRGRAMLSWIDSLAPEEFEAAVDRFRSLGLTEARMGEYSMLLTAWAELDPTAALAYTQENTGGGMATGTVLTAWASRDPEAAIAWANANHKGDDPNPFMVGIIRGLVESNPARATELLEGLPFSRERGDALAAMMPHLMQMGNEGAKDWIANIKDERLRDGAVARFADQMAKNDPAGTAKWLLDNPGNAANRSIHNVYGEWWKQDKTAALSQFEKLPEGEARSRALSGLVITESRENPAAAAKLLNQFPADRSDRLVQHFVWTSFREAPEIAIGEISSIQNEGDRNRTYQRTLNHWLGRDPQAAQSWINSANLPDQIIQRLNIPSRQ